MPTARRPWVLARYRAGDRLPLDFDGIWGGRPRACPRCGRAFTSRFDKGACPGCYEIFDASKTNPLPDDVVLDDHIETAAAWLARRHLAPAALVPAAPSCIPDPPATAPKYCRRLWSEGRDEARRAVARGGVLHLARGDGRFLGYLVLQDGLITAELRPRDDAGNDLPPIDLPAEEAPCPGSDA